MSQTIESVRTPVMSTLDSEELRRQIAHDGQLIVRDVLTPAEVCSLKAALERAIDAEAEYHGSKTYADYGMVLLCALYGREFIDLCGHERIMAPFHAVLGPGCIIYAYTSSSMPPNGKNYSARIHVDCPRLIPGYVTNMGATILLDDFTVDNGATWFLSGSHTRPDPPPEEEFFAHASRLAAPAGSVWYFNARVWHRGGENRKSNWRHALTLNMCRPWMKQRLDIPRAMSGIDLAGAPELAKQKLGFFAQPPASYDEFYVPPERRTFRQRPE
jgi:ectoine hydroxylase-related dioxygenase (phytanoyl-CoA dioxygenase family)